MRNFSFSNLLGGKPKPAAKTAADEDQATDAENGDEEDKAAEESAAEDGEEDKAAEESAAEDGEEDKAAEEDDDQASGFLKGRRAERKRIGAILSSDAVTAGNLAQAVHIACNTGLKPAAAIQILKAAPAGGVSRLSEAMRGRGPKPLPSPAAGGAKGPSSADLMKRRFSTRN